MKDMTPSWTQNANGPFNSNSASASTSSSQTSFCQYLPNSRPRYTGENVFRLLAWREVSPCVKRPLKRQWGEAARWSVDCSVPRCEVTDAKTGLLAWVEAESLRNFSAKYCPLVPPPRSTIAAAFSPDGQTLASTHGDHTVKIIYCRMGTCLKVLSGHRRTPWVVRFHPSHPEILASGSLDHEVRIWDANSAECIGSRDFYRPIASIAFHAQGDLLAVASGHKLYIWQYNKNGDNSPPIIVLKTRRSLRAVHFHPRAAPLLLTAEVNDLDSPDSPMTLATSPGYLQYPPPAVVFTPVHANTAPGNSDPGVNFTPLMPFPSLFWPPTFVNESDVRSSQAEGMMAETVSSRQDEAENVPQSHVVDDIEVQTESMAWPVPMDVSPSIAHGRPTHERSTSRGISENIVNDSLSNETSNVFSASGVDTFRFSDRYNSLRESHTNSSIQESEDAVYFDENLASDRFRPMTRSFQGESSSRLARTQTGAGMTMRAGILPTGLSTNNLQVLLGSGSSSHLHQFLPVADHIGWELPFLQGWLMGQTQAGLSTNLPIVDRAQGGMFGIPTMPSHMSASDSHRLQNHGFSLLSSTVAGIAAARVAGRSGGRHRSRTQLHSFASTGSSGMVAGGGASGRSDTVDVGMNIASEDTEIQNNLGATEADVAAAQATMAAAAAAAAAAELPCTVKLRIWPHNVKLPCELLDPETCRLTIPHAVLCSEMGAHFSPCGRFLAACVACVLPQQELEAGLHSQSNQVAGGMATSPTRHPISAQQVVYELRIYSLEEATFGEVLASRAIRAAHCLTSIQFSPTSAHILLAYGRRHNSLLRSIVVDGTTTVPIYTILEIYRVSDMELVRVLPSAEDEVNVACFHPLVGGGLVYGTKEGKLRILQYDRTQGQNYTGISNVMEHNMLEVQTIALEC